MVLIEPKHCRPSSTRPEWLQADRRQTKVTSFGFTPSSHICFECSRASYHAHAWQILQAWHSKRAHHVRASCWTLSKPPPCSHILHTCQQGYSPQWHLTNNHFEWPAHEHTCPLQVQLNQHRHSVRPQKSQGISPYLPIAFVEIVPMPPALAHISLGYHSIPRNYIAWGHLIEDS